MDEATLGVAGIASGWTVVTIMVLGLYRALSKGKLITPREAREMQRRIVRLEEALDTKDDTIASFKDSLATSTEAIRAVLEVARERQP